MKCQKRSFVSALLLVLLIGCGLSSEKARLKLEQMEIAYTDETFIDYIKKADADVVKLFLIAGMDPNTWKRWTIDELLDPWGEVADSILIGSKKTPVLSLAASLGHTKIVKVLLDYMGISLKSSLSKIYNLKNSTYSYDS